MVPRDAHDLPALRRGRHPERVALALHDEDGDTNTRELVDAGRPVRAPGRMQRKGEAKDARDRGRLSGPAGDARSGRPPAGDERDGCERAAAQTADDGEPRGVELGGRRGAAAAGDAVGLLDERHRDLQAGGGTRRGGQVGCPDASARSVPEHEQRARLARPAHRRTREAVRRLDLDRPVCQRAQVNDVLSRAPRPARREANV